MKEPTVAMAFRDKGGIQLLDVAKADVQKYKTMGWTLLNAEPPAPKPAPVISQTESAAFVETAAVPAAAKPGRVR